MKRLALGGYCPELPDRTHTLVNRARKKGGDMTGLSPVGRHRWLIENIAAA